MNYSCTITGPAGTIQLHNPGTYKLEKTTRDNRQVTQRKIEATNPFVSGTFTVATVKENVVENVSIYVYAVSASLLRQRVEAVCDALDQTNYTIVFSTEESDETWTCMAADYAIQSSHELQHSYMALIKANVPRLPQVVFS